MLVGIGRTACARRACLWRVYLFAVLALPVWSAGLGQTVDIRDFGARCDGSDDRSAVQLAIDKLRDGGTLKFSCLATVHSPGVTLANRTEVTVTAGRGGGMKALDDNGNRSWSLFQVTNCTRCIIQNLLLDSNWMPAISLHINASRETTIQGNTVQNVSQPAGCALCSINGIGNRNNRYVYNNIFHTGEGKGWEGTRGLWVGQGKDYFEYYPVVEHNHVSDTGHTGIVVTAEGAIVRYNEIEGVHSAAAAGIKVALDVQNGTHPVVVEYNTVRDVRAAGIQVEAAAPVTTTPVYVRNNILRHTAGSGVYIGSRPGIVHSNVYVLGNELIDTGNQHPYAITVFAVDGVTIEGNRIIKDPKTPFRSGPILLAGNDGSIANVKISDNEISGSSGAGIRIAAGNRVANVTITDNAFTDNKTYGVEVDPDPGITGVVLAGPNCFAGNGRGTVEDSRRLIVAPPQRGECTHRRRPQR